MERLLLNPYDYLDLCYPVRPDVSSISTDIPLRPLPSLQKGRSRRQRQVLRNAYVLTPLTLTSPSLSISSLTIHLRIGLDLCDGYTETYRRCPSKKLGLLDGQPSSEALGRYCQEHSCNKCGAREDMDYCRKCTCVTLSCYDVRSDKYKNSAYCTPHTCTKCHVRPKDRNKSRCVVC